MSKRAGARDGRHFRGHDICGVWLQDEQRFCEERIVLYRRCRCHVDALKRDDLYMMISQARKGPERDMILDTLDRVQKTRPSGWKYEGREDELAAAVSQEGIESDGKTSEV